MNNLDNVSLRTVIILWVVAFAITALVLKYFKLLGEGSIVIIPIIMTIAGIVHWRYSSAHPQEHESTQRIARYPFLYQYARLVTALAGGILASVLFLGGPLALWFFDFAHNQLFYVLSAIVAFFIWKMYKPSFLGVIATILVHVVVLVLVYIYLFQ